MSLYETVREELLRRVRNGTYACDTLLPSVATLSEEFGVSPITVKRALRDLRAAGVLVTIRGKGAYVKKQVRILRQLDMRMHSLHGTDISLISVTREKISDPSMVSLAPPDQMMLCVRKVISSDGAPFLYDASYLSSNVEDEIVDEFGRNFIVDALRKREIRIVKTEIVVEAFPATGKAAEIFDVPNGFPMLRRNYKMVTTDANITIYGVVQAPFDRLACSIDFPTLAMEI
ncbi:DNA-binding GntR family transcriptional regulator [Paraburkholderia sp. RAU2J]|uniref:GntR family transcriptional regulator n=1 Tax=Paraburkholderia sp. RAU2J TaxID=1938810 RepID=UPI000EAE2DB1|nr:GntR family transcriptional regulator [Paraburkholderia sp. RAU2J]RKT10794.1 DNA-binding GntR family transcriptional regulator [Paraburkholderia sp. RAU2J]